MDIIQIICEGVLDNPTFPKMYAPEYDQLFEQYGNTVAQLEQTLSPEQWKLFLELEAQRNLLGAMEEDSCFCVGFRIGAKLMLDILEMGT